MWLKCFLQVSTNGLLSFRQSVFLDFDPDPFPLGDAGNRMDTAVIAPFWDDSVDGSIYYRVSIEPHLLDNVSSTISDAFDVDFRATVAFVATWDEVQVFTGVVSNNSQEVASRTQAATT